MSKTFYTERDIELLAEQGVKSIVVNEDVVLTELAREKADRLGIALKRQHDTPPSAPLRPYLSQDAAPAPTQSVAGGAGSGKADLRARVRDKVIARLGSEVDPHLLETIINRVLDNVGTGG